MNRCLSSLLLALISTCSVYGQEIVFDRFRFEQGFGCAMLSIKYVCQSDNPIKYATVHFSILNAVGDEVPNLKGLKELNVKITGPIKKKDKDKNRYYVFTKAPMPLTPKPKMIDIEYMDDSIEDVTIIIDDDNLKTYFPNWFFREK